MTMDKHKFVCNYEGKVINLNSVLYFVCDVTDEILKSSNMDFEEGFIENPDKRWGIYVVYSDSERIVMKKGFESKEKADRYLYDFLGNPVYF